MSAASRVARFRTDEDLAEALLAREPAAALVAWQRFRPLVRGILRSRLGSADVVDDVE